MKTTLIADVRCPRCQAAMIAHEGRPNVRDDAWIECATATCPERRKRYAVPTVELVPSAMPSPVNGGE
jgi:hypothetical protein